MFPEAPRPRLGRQAQGRLSRRGRPSDRNPVRKKWKHRSMEQRIMDSRTNVIPEPIVRIKTSEMSVVESILVSRCSRPRLDSLIGKSKKRTLKTNVTGWRRMCRSRSSQVKISSIVITLCVSFNQFQKCKLKVFD